MSEHDVRALVEKLQSDEDFRSKVEEAPTPEEGREILESAGFDLSDDDTEELRHAAEGQPSDEEIENAGGPIFPLAVMAVISFMEGNER